MFCNDWETPIAFDLTWRGEEHTFILSQDVPTREEGQGYADIERTHFHIVTTQGRDAMEDVRLGCNTEVLGTFGSFVGETRSVGGVQKTRFERSANRFWSVEQYVFDIAKRCLREKANWPKIKRSSKDDTCSTRLSTAAFAARSQAGTRLARRGGRSKAVIGGRIERRPSPVAQPHVVVEDVHRECLPSINQPGACDDSQGLHISVGMLATVLSYDGLRECFLKCK